MAGMNYAMQAQSRGLQVNEFMGPVGLPAEAAAQGAQQDPAVPGQIVRAGTFMPTVNEMQAIINESHDAWRNLKNLQKER